MIKCAAMRRLTLRRLTLAALILWLASAPTDASQSGHTLLGDFRVNEAQADPTKPITYHLILYTRTGNVIARQTVTNNGRYRFLDLSNGEYIIVVEVENTEVARIPILIRELRKTDIQHDIALEWRANAKTSAVAGTVSAQEFYQRTPANESRFERAQVAIRRKDYRQAVSLLGEIVAEDAKDFAAWTELGTAHFREEKFDEAEKCYRRALEVRPSFLLALLNMGKARMALKNFEGAIELLSEAVRLHPLSADANYFLGEAYLQIRRGSKAVGYLKEAIRLEPAGKAEAHLRLAALYNAAGLKDKAAIEYEQFLSKKPDHPDRKKFEQYIRENRK